MKKKTIVILAGAAAVAVAAVLAWRILPGMLGSKEKSAAQALPAVAAENPLVRTIEQSSDLVGTVEPDSIVYVTPLGSGEITSVNVQAGDTVAAGQLLCVIDTKQVESSRIGVETTRIAYEDARKNRERCAVLYEAGDMAQADYQSLVVLAELAKLQYDNAKIAYNIQVESSQVKAPIEGRVESLNIKIHDKVSSQVTLCVISGQGGKGITFYVSERIVTGLKAGDSLEAQKNGTTYQASITEVSTMTDPDSGLFKVKASVPEGEALVTGSSVKLSVVSRRAENVLAVPVDCVYYEGGEPFIYTYAAGEGSTEEGQGDGVLKKKPVETGLSDSEYIEITSGITADDQVVISWTSEMYDGSRVALAQ